MAGLSDLLGKNSVIEQLLLWGVLNQVIGNLAGPGMTALAQDSNAAHPELALTPEQAAELLARHQLTHGQAASEAAKGGIDGQRFDHLAELAKVRLPPADLATAVLRSYMGRAEAEGQAAPQGFTAGMLGTLIDLAGDAPGPDQLAVALRRGIIGRDGSGAASTSFEQGIRETRLHDKWAPIIAELSKVLLSPPDAASAVVRNFIGQGAAAELAAKQGVDAHTFGLLVDLSGDAPGPQQLAEALRRGVIPLGGTGPAAVSFDQGIAEGRLKNKWAPVIQDLAKVWPTPVDAIDAGLKGQLPPDEALATYIRLGGDEQFYQWLLDTAGNPPSPLEAAEMAIRGIIPWEGIGADKTTFAQAIREGRTKAKWTQQYRKMSEYLPPPGEIVTFLAHAAITRERATQLLHQHNMSDETLAAFLNEAELTALTDYRGLTQSAVVDMYFAHLISHDQATSLLEVLHVTPQAAELLLAYADLREVTDSIVKSVQRIASLFTGRKISVDTAREALIRLEIPSGSVEQIIQTWELQAQANVKTLSETQIIDAWFYKVLDQDTAITFLGAIGYTPFDAWVLLSNKAKGPLPGQPPMDVAAPAGAVIPGVT